MNRAQSRLWSVLVCLGLAMLACSPLGGGAAVQKTATPAATRAPAGANPTNTPGANANPAASDTPAGGGAATEVPSPTYDGIAAQLTVPPLLTANAATATAATGALRQWAQAAVASTQYGDQDWAATQATGAPDSSATCGDNKTAWASAGNSGADNLTLVYTTTVVPVAVNIYETNGPGSIIKVEVLEAGGAAHTVYSALPLVSKECPRVFSVGITGVTAHVNRVKISLDQSVVGTWDEIDAVELVGNP